MTHVRNNRTEKCKLAFEQKQIDRMIAQKMKEQRVETFRLKQDLARRAKPPTPSIDSFLGKQSKRHIQFQVKEQERNDKIYADLCKANLRDFRQLRLPQPGETPLFLLKLLIDKEKIKRERKKLLDIERERIAAKLREKESKDDDEAVESDDQSEDESTEDEEIISSKEDKESSSMYHGRRRFTMTAYGAMPDLRRMSNSAVSDLAAILQLQESNCDNLTDDAFNYDNDGESKGSRENSDVENEIKVNKPTLDAVTEEEENDD